MLYRWRYWCVNVGGGTMAMASVRRWRQRRKTSRPTELGESGHRCAKSEYVMLKSIVIATRRAQDELSAWMNLGENVL